MAFLGDGLARGNVAYLTQALPRDIIEAQIDAIFDDGILLLTAYVEA